MKKLLEEMLKENAGIDNAFLIKGKGLILRVPRDAQEIKNEGAALHHCVGTYVDRVAKGQTHIFFVRRVEEPDTPYFTMEYNKGRVIQCRGQSQLRDAVISKNFCSCIRETDERTRRKDRKEVRVMAKQIIRSIRKGSVQWNEEDRLQMVSMLAKAGYAVQIVRKEIPSSETRKTTQYEYVIEYGEKVE